MIIFEKIRYKNFLATGNEFTEIILNRSKSTLVIGQNGSGKTSIIQALVFALYGKAYANINKNQLVNSITRKDCLVELEFTVGINRYMIRRGIKPNIFEIYQNDVMIEQDSDIRDYQDLLEKNIIKMNYKSCCQIVILGSTNYVPFMELPAADRRAVVEDVLDIQIFSLMNSILKQDIDKNKSEIESNQNKIELTSKLIEANENHNKSLQLNIEEIIQTKQNNINSLQTEITYHADEISKLELEEQELRDSILDSQKVNDSKVSIFDYDRTFKDKRKKAQSELSFFENNNSCPTCHQSINEEFKNTKIESNKKTIEKYDDALNKLSVQYEKVMNRINEITEVYAQITKCVNSIRDHKNIIKSHLSIIDKYNEEINKIRSTSSKNLDTSNTKQLEGDLDKYTSKKNDLHNIKDIHNESQIFLKDSGIKTKIIKKYIPVINKYINKYLADLDFFVNFELDEKFNETIKSRGRDDFTFSSFSEGEKARLNIALMFAWREVAKIRNSSSSNLLIMDEITDSSLDLDGTENFLKIIDNMSSENNIFVISHHGDRLYDKFHSIIEVEKVKNFSKIKRKVDNGL